MRVPVRSLGDPRGRPQGRNISGASGRFDRVRLLAGLQNVLHRERKRWTMEFALGGQAALDLLGRQPYDCVVTDMRMPIIDGAAVVDAVRRDHPATRCVLLSGSDCERIASAVDELLVKPCSVATLRATLERMLR